jgi:phage terminase small subunit
VVTVPRKETRLTERQEAFIDALIEGKTRRQAVADAGYAADTDKDKDSCASVLLRNPKVFAAYHDRRAQVSARADFNAVKWLEWMQLVVVDACREGDWAGAVGALREIGKYLGVYEVDHRQRKLGPQDVDALRAKLTAAGFDYTRTNAPAHLRITPQTFQQNGNTGGQS